MGLFDIQPPLLRICMFGSRGVGKTTVLASIFKDSLQGISGSQIYMKGADADSSQLLEYAGLLEKAIEEKNPAMLPATNTEADYKFAIGLLGKPTAVELQIKDFPGEYLASSTSADNKEKVAEFVKSSQVILVAVDTPYLMEAEQTAPGKFNDQKNDPATVMAYFRQNPDSFKDKLVLFVPLKCERYFYDGRIQQVTDRVRQAYEPIRQYFLDNNIASAIVPILTLGGMEFDCMTDGMVAGSPTKLARFRMYDKNPVYNPLFCVQPIYYLLYYVAVYYAWFKQHASLIQRMKNILFAFLTKDDKFRAEILKMRHNIITNELGFETFTSSSIFQI